MLRPVKRRFFILLSLHHQNNHLENIFIFFHFATLLNSAAKKQFLGRKNIGGTFAPPLHQASYAYVYNMA